MFEKIKRDLEKYEGLSYLVDDIYLHKNEFKDLYKYGMVLLGPDSFIQGEALSIIDFFRQKRFDLVSVKFKVLNRTQVEHLFLPTSSCIKCGDLKWWMIQDSADQGMFCGVLFFCDDASEEVNCLNKLNMYKGRSNPLDNASGVVRYDFSAINVCLNLIHVPDTYGDFFKDTSPFYGIGELAEITRLKKNDCYMEENYEFQIKLHENVNKYSFEILLYKVKYYLICLITNKCNHELNSTYYQNQYNIIVNLANSWKKAGYKCKKEVAMIMIHHIVISEDGSAKIIWNL